MYLQYVIRYCITLEIFFAILCRHEMRTVTANVYHCAVKVIPLHDDEKCGHTKTFKLS